MNNSNRLPEWRYDIRRFCFTAALLGLLYVSVSLFTSTFGVDICAEDICYEPYTTEGSD